MSKTKRRTIDDRQKERSDILRKAALIAQAEEEDSLSDTDIFDAKDILERIRKGPKSCNGKLKQA